MPITNDNDTTATRPPKERKKAKRVSTWRDAGGRCFHIWLNPDDANMLEALQKTMGALRIGGGTPTYPVILKIALRRFFDQMNPGRGFNEQAS